MISSKPSPLIELRELSRHYVMGKPSEASAVVVKALQGVNLRIEAGEYVAIMGQSGSGKSTMMNILGCLDRPSEGQFLIDGKDASGFKPDELAALRRERFGFIFQRYHLLADMDAQANAALPAVYSGRSSRQRLQRAAELLVGLGLGERLHHKPNELSGGQQQRVSIARALMNGGQIILADEPTGALDSASGADMLRHLDALHDQGHTIIVVTHDAKVAAHAKRVIELSDGKVVRDNGTPTGHHPPVLPNGLINRQGAWWAHWLVQLREALSSALAALKANRLRSALSMLGICIGIMAVVITTALGDAARKGIENSLGSSVTSKIWVWTSSNELPRGAKTQSFRPYELDAMRAIQGVMDVQPEQQLQGSLRQGTEQTNGETQSATPYSLVADQQMLELGRYFIPADMDNRAQVAIINYRLWNDLFKRSVRALGATVLIDMGNGTSKSVGGALPVRVIGVLKEKRSGEQMNGAGLYVPQTTFASKIDSDPNTSSFKILVAAGQDPLDIEKQVRHRLKSLHGVEDFQILNGDKFFRSIQDTMVIISFVFTGVSAIALLVGGVGVMNIMLVSVSERTCEIGIRMAVGARQSDMRMQFLIESVMLCCMGGLAGLVLSWLAAQGANAMQADVTIEISGKAVALAFGVSSFIGLLFGTLPAQRAALLSPVEALSRE
jgi:macrolide transport system ATP-binding/permease protein